MQDDNRGVGQGVTDNKVTPNRFRLLVERRSGGDRTVPLQPMGYLSVQAHLVSQELIYPVHTMPKVREWNSIRGFCIVSWSYHVQDQLYDSHFKDVILQNSNVI